MANLSRKKHGENAGKDMTVIAMLYDKSVSHSKKDPEKVTGYFPTFGIHPEDPHFEGDTNPFLVNEETDTPRPNGEGNYINHSTMLHPSQLEELKAAAGDNTTPLLDKDGNQVGTTYAVTIDARYLGKDTGYGPDFSKKDADGKPRDAFRPTELTVDENTVNTFYEKPAELRAERAKAKEAEVEGKADEKAVDPKRSAAAKKAAKTRAANKAAKAAEAASVEASNDEPSFG